MFGMDLNAILPLLQSGKVQGVFGGAGAAPKIDAMSGVNRAFAENAAAKPQRRGIFDRIGDALQDPTTRGALLRSGAATINGGLGDGIAAGADFVDRRRAQDIEQRRWELGHGLDERRVANAEKGTELQHEGLHMDDNYRYDSLGETKRSNKARENLTARGQDYDVQVATRGQDVTTRGQDLDYNATTRSQDLNFETANRDRRSEEGSAAYQGTRYQPTVTRKRIFEEVPAIDGWFHDTPGQPRIEETYEQPMTQPPPPAAAINALRQNPERRAEFEAKYGVSADTYLGVR